MTDPKAIYVLEIILATRLDVYSLPMRRAEAFRAFEITINGKHDHHSVALVNTETGKRIDERNCAHVAA